MKRTFAFLLLAFLFVSIQAQEPKWTTRHYTGSDGGLDYSKGVYGVNVAYGSFSNSMTDKKPLKVMAFITNPVDQNFKCLSFKFIDQNNNVYTATQTTSFNVSIILDDNVDHIITTKATLLKGDTELQFQTYISDKILNSKKALFNIIDDTSPSRDTLDFILYNRNVQQILSSL